MTHVRITPDGFWVDGVRVDVHANDLDVDLSTTPPTVRCTIPADTVEIDLPDAVLEATKIDQHLLEMLASIRATFERLSAESTGRGVREAINLAGARGRRERGA